MKTIHLTDGIKHPRKGPLCGKDLVCTVQLVHQYILLRSADDPYCLHEPRTIGEREFANCSFSYIAPRLYKKLPITIKQINSLNTFKSHLKAFLFSHV